MSKILRPCTILTVCSLLVLSAFSAQKADEKGWVTLFDGKSLEGWKASENVSSWKIEDGALVANGPRSHLYYVGAAEPFKNFELQVEAMTTPGSNSGVYFHTQYQDTGWPKYGFEVQVNTSHTDKIKTGSIYAVQNVGPEAASKDNEWFTMTITVNGKRVTTKVNDQTLVDYTEPEGKAAGADYTRVLDKGTFALQAHDPKSKVSFRSIKVKRLP